MQQPNTAQLEAIKRVAARPEGMLIHEYLKGEMDKIIASLVATEDAHLTRRFQGEARVLDVLLKVWKS